MASRIARIVPNFHRRSPTLATIQILGLWTMAGRIYEMKLTLLGRMCRAGVNSVHKSLLYFRFG
jgi:hypothetical protein